MSEINENNFGSAGEEEMLEQPMKKNSQWEKKCWGKSRHLNGHQSFIYTPEVESPNSW